MREHCIYARHSLTRIKAEHLPQASVRALTYRQVKGSHLGPREQTRISYKLESSLDSVDRVEEAVEQFARNHGASEDETYRISMAVREATANAVLHGNAYDPQKRITVSFEHKDADLIIRIADQGKGLDPTHIPDPLAPENLMRGSGRGIFLIRSFMDQVEFRDLHPGTELTLVKHLGGEKQAATERQTQ